jgi:hypothetical protein
MTKKIEATNEVVVEVNEVDTKLASIETVSGKIRYLASLGWKRGAIAKKLEKRYQHVRNVLTAPVKKTEAK